MQLRCHEYLSGKKGVSKVELMTNIINLFKDSIDYPHIVCDNCNESSFYIEVFEEDGIYKFLYIVCTHCKQAIALNMTPVFTPKGEVNERT